MKIKKNNPANRRSVFNPNFWNVKSREFYIQKSLLEAYHVYNKNDKAYDTAIKQAILNCKLQFKQKNNWIYFKNNPILYTKTNIPYKFETLKEITFYRNQTIG